MISVGGRCGVPGVTGFTSPDNGVLLRAGLFGAQAASLVPQTYTMAGLVRVVMSRGACPNICPDFILRGRCRCRSMVTLTTAISRRAARWVVARTWVGRRAVASPAATVVISRLTLDHVLATGDQVRLRLGREPIVLPESLASLVLDLAATGHGHTAIGDQGTSPWLFPGGRPGRPISSCRLTERLRNISIYPGQARSTALFQLATELSATVLAHLLWIHITVAVAWQRASAGGWTTYAAHISHRTSR